MKKTGIILCLLSLLFLSLTAMTENSGDEESMTMNELIYDQISNPVRPDLSLIPEGSDLVKDGHLTKTYFRLQDFYARMLWNWMDSKVNLKEHEESLWEHSLHFRPAAEPLTAFRKKYAFGDGFFCIRNILCIERLTEEELAELRRLESLGDAGTEECRNLVDDTVRKLCTVYADEDEQIRVVHEGGGESAPNCSILLGLEIDIDFDADDLSLEKERINAIKDLAAAFEKEFSDAAGISVTIFLYY